MEQDAEKFDPKSISIQLRGEANRLLNLAASLQEKAESLLDSAAILEEQSKTEAETTLTGPRRPSSSIAPAKPQRAQRGARIIQVRNLLRFGPMSRSDIQKKMKIPKGTLDHLLKPGGEFVKGEDGLYRIKPKDEVASLSAKVSEIEQQNLMKGDSKG